MYKKTTPELDELKFNFKNFDERMKVMEERVRQMVLKEKNKKRKV